MSEQNNNITDYKPSIWVHGSENEETKLPDIIQVHKAPSLHLHRCPMDRIFLGRMQALDKKAGFSLHVMMMACPRLFVQ